MLHSFLKPTSEALRLWLCMYVEDQGCQAINNPNEMLRGKNSALTLYEKWLQDPTNHTKVLYYWPWWFSRRTGSLLPTTLILNSFPLCSRHFLFVIRMTRAFQMDVRWPQLANETCPYKIASWPLFFPILMQYLLLRRVSLSLRNFFSWRSKLNTSHQDLKLMIKLLLVALTDASVVLSTSLLYGLVKCSAVTYRKTLSKLWLA